MYKLWTDMRVNPPDQFHLKLNKKIRFLAVEWDERWSYGHPIMLLEPFIRFSTLGGTLDGFIDAAILDILINYKMGIPTYTVVDEQMDVVIEGGWNPHDLFTLAEKSIMDDGYPVGEKKYRGILRNVIFYKDEGVLKWKEKN